MVASSEVTKTNAALYEKKDHVAWITLNRPEQMNAKNADLVTGVARGMRAASTDDDVYVAVLIGAGGKAFCAGMDLKERNQRNQQNLSPDTRDIGDDFKTYDCTKPVIAAIDGYAVAGGLQLASECDIRIATEKSQFGQPEPRWALNAVSSINTPERFMPLGEVMNILLTGSRITAQRAYDIGYIQFLVKNRDALIAKVEEVTGEIKKCAPMAVQLIKKSLRLWMDAPVVNGETALGYAQQQTAADRKRNAQSEDAKLGPKAFAEKRTPQWTMR
ncbi:MAG: enoyl-CoA hydratase-related protein [Chloroflexota bacterium]